MINKRKNKNSDIKEKTKPKQNQENSTKSNEANKSKNMKENKKKEDNQKLQDKETNVNVDNNIEDDKKLQSEQDNNDNTTQEEDLSEDIRDEKFLELQARFDDINDRYLRLFSEFDNFRKRMTREKLELTKTAAEDVIESLLPILDDLERAVESANNDNDQSSTKEGLELILSKFKTVLRQQGVEEIKAIGEDFNTDYHEAVNNVEAEKNEDIGKIVDVVQKGYLLNEKVLRFSKVVVAN